MSEWFCCHIEIEKNNEARHRLPSDLNCLFVATYPSFIRLQPWRRRVRSVQRSWHSVRQRHSVACHVNRGLQLVAGIPWSRDRSLSQWEFQWCNRISAGHPEPQHARRDHSLQKVLEKVSVAIYTYIFLSYSCDLGGLPGFQKKTVEDFQCSRLIERKPSMFCWFFNCKR